eukprot:scaffold193485_cov32-Tisochrysis_lutea.AAC.8
MNGHRPYLLLGSLVRPPSRSRLAARLPIVRRGPIPRCVPWNREPISAATHPNAAPVWGWLPQRRRRQSSSWVACR